MTDEPTDTTTRPTVLEEYYEKHGADRKRLRLDRFEDAGAKQRLMMLVEDDMVTPLQARALGRRMDSCEEDPLETALAELADGTLEVQVHDPKAKKGVLRLAALREKKPGASKKQELIDLREAGSLTPGQVREGALLMAKQKGISTEQVLVAVGAEHLLDTMPEAIDAGSADEDEGEGTGDPDSDDGEALGGEPDTGSGDSEEGEIGAAEEAPDTSIDASSKSGPPLTLASLLDKSVPDIVAALEKIQSKAAVVQLIVLEEGGKTRTSLMPDLRSRAKALGATDEEIETALEIAGQEDGIPAEDAYEGVEGEADEDGEDEAEEEPEEE